MYIGNIEKIEKVKTVKVLRNKNMDYKNSDGSWKWGAYEQAIKHGCLDDVKYLHKNGCKWTTRTSKKASKYGQLNILKYLHKNSDFQTDSKHFLPIVSHYCYRLVFGRKSTVKSLNVEP